MNKKILFRLNDLEPWYYTRFGEIFELTRTCYFKGKELGFLDGDIYLEWPENVIFYNKIKYNFHKNTILPINYIEKDSYEDNEFDKIVNLNEVGSLYPNSPKFCSNGKKNNMPLFNYSNKYYMETKEYAVFNLKKRTLNKNYILIHIRQLFDSVYRNTDFNLMNIIYNSILTPYKEKYDIFFFGDANFPGGKYIDYFYDINKFINLINNSSLVIGNPSGPNTYAIGLGIPYIEIDTPNTNKPSKSAWYTSGYWKDVNGVYGETAFDFIDKSKLSVVYKNTPIEEKLVTIKNFISEVL